jgi:K+-dependent Na+/Ca+ exchanger-like protein
MTATISLSFMLAAIYVLAIVTDEFFIPSLDRISHRWRLPSNVAGASLMAVGSSAPELAIAFLSLFKDGGAHSDVGAGTIVGSAVFNMLVITGVSAICREARISLPAVVRDTIFYFLAVFLLAAVFWDGSITTVECLMFLGLYAGYLAFLFAVPLGGDEAVDPASSADAAKRPAAGVFGRLKGGIVGGIGRLAGGPNGSDLRMFGVSILSIVILSWILVDTAVIFAGAIGLPPVVIALTVLAAGTSAPDLIASVVVAKQGRGGMAVANAIGSNIFDVLVGLGLPWLVALTLLGRPFVSVGTHDLFLSVLILMGTVALLFVFLYTDRLLSRREGVALLGCYGLYAGWTLIG